ncbi:MAG: TetR/AcrR family transcriptional regulator [Flavobacteriaceae bacterium]|nr:TetR/AcrR family transcriptional regulator [Flavobacteriaceae bacterium]
MKEKILKKAIELFLTLGFKSVTMDDIASEMAISKKTIYAHFKNKTQLVEATTLHVFEIITEGIDCICSLNKNPIEELYEIKKFVMIHLKNDKSSPQYQLQKYYPEIHETLKTKQFETMQSCVITNLNKGIKLKLYRDNLNVEFASRIYFLGITGIKDETLFPFNIFPRINLMEDYLEYHIRGIVTEKGLIKLNQITKNIN